MSVSATAVTCSLTIASNEERSIPTNPIARRGDNPDVAAFFGAGLSASRKATGADEPTSFGSAVPVVRGVAMFMRSADLPEWLGFCAGHRACRRSVVLNIERNRRPVHFFSLVVPARPFNVFQCRGTTTSRLINSRRPADLRERQWSLCIWPFRLRIGPMSPSALMHARVLEYSLSIRRANRHWLCWRRYEDV
jgi:hypothetical protein